MCGTLKYDPKSLICLLLTVYSINGNTQIATYIYRMQMGLSAQELKGIVLSCDQESVERKHQEPGQPSIMPVWA